VEGHTDIETLRDQKNEWLDHWYIEWNDSSYLYR